MIFATVDAARRAGENSRMHLWIYYQRAHIAVAKADVRLLPVPAAIVAPQDAPAVRAGKEDRRRPRVDCERENIGGVRPEGRKRAGSRKCLPGNEGQNRKERDHE